MNVIPRRLFAPLAFGFVIAAGSVSSPAAVERIRGPWLLTALPSMGTVTWRCDPARERSGRSALALALDASRAAATQTIELRAGGTPMLRRTVEPGQTVDLPYVSHAVQQLTIVQSTKPGTLRAVVTVDFSPRPVSPSHCWEHLPPALSVRVFPR